MDAVQINQGKSQDTRFMCLVFSLIMFRFLLGYLLVFMGFDYLEDNKFLIDTQKIYQAYSIMDFNNVFKFEVSDSFFNTARLYRIMFLNLDLNYNNFLLLSGLTYMFLYIYLVYSVKVRHNHKLFPVFICVFIFDTIFLFMPSKELFSLFLNILIVKAITREKISFKLYVPVLILLYGLFFRMYYLSIVLLYILCMLLRRVNLKWKLVLISMVAGCFIYMFYYTGYLDRIINLRYWSEKLLSGETNTIIMNVIPYGYGERNILKFAGNYIINAVRLLMPVEVLWKSFSRGLVFVPLQLGLTLYIARLMILLHKHTKAGKASTSRVIDTDIKIIMYICSFFAVSALFEPDFGSVFRHSMNLLPFILYLVFQADMPMGIEQLYKVAKEDRVSEDFACNTGDNGGDPGIFETSVAQASDQWNRGRSGMPFLRAHGKGIKADGHRSADYRDETADIPVS